MRGREYSLNMAEAADFGMPDAFAKDYLDRIIKKREKSLNNTCILYTGRKTKSGYTVIDVRLPETSLLRQTILPGIIYMWRF
jgi:hypothetical protein